VGLPCLQWTVPFLLAAVPNYERDSMGDLYLIEHPDDIVFIYSPTSCDSWQLSRLSPCQKSKVVFVLVWLARESKEGWVLQDQSPGAKGSVIGVPGSNVEEERHHPPLGPWRKGGFQCTLAKCSPKCPPLDDPLSIQSPFATFDYQEDGNIARLGIKIHTCVIIDKDLEDVLSNVRNLVLNLARRSHMVLVICADAQDAAVPAFRHIRRFLNFVQDHGPELFLVGRGTAIVLRPRGILGATLVSIIKMVQRMLPSPWPEAIVPTRAEAEAFLAQHAAPFLGPPPDALRSLQPCAEAAEPCIEASLCPPLHPKFDEPQLESQASKSGSCHESAVCKKMFEQPPLDTESAQFVGIHAPKQQTSEQRASETLTSEHASMVETLEHAQVGDDLLIDNAVIANTSSKWGCLTCAAARRNNWCLATQ